MLKRIIQIDYKYSFQLALKYSVVITSIFVAIFVLAKVLGLARFTELRFINYAVVFFVCYEALKKAYNDNGHYLEYFRGLMIGILTATFGQLWYAILFFIYLYFDPVFLNYLLTIELPRIVAAPRLCISALLFSEGFGLSPIISLGLMQYFKSKQGRWAHEQS